MKRECNPTTHLRKEMLKRAQWYHNEAAERGVVGHHHNHNSHPPSSLTRPEVDTIQTAATRFITYTENFPDASLEELKEEESFMSHTCAVYFEADLSGEKKY